MKLRRFCHGVHLSEDGKTLTADRAIRSFRPTGEAVYPLNQHIGAPAVPCVKKGAVVLEGQLIASAAEGKLSVNIHSSVKGRVKEITDKFIMIQQ